MDSSPISHIGHRADRGAGGWRRLLFATAGALAVVLGVASGASADPNNANTFPLDLNCANGQHHTVTVLAPAPEEAAVHIVDSTAVLVPTRFQWHMLVTDAAGHVLDETSTPPDAVHGRSVEHLETVECTFTQFAHHEWPGVGAVTIRVDGTVDAYLPR